MFSFPILVPAFASLLIAGANCLPSALNITGISNTSDTTVTWNENFTAGHVDINIANSPIYLSLYVYEERLLEDQRLLAKCLQDTLDWVLYHRQLSRAPHEVALHCSGPDQFFIRNTPGPVLWGNIADTIRGISEWAFQEQLAAGYQVREKLDNAVIAVGVLGPYSIPVPPAEPSLATMNTTSPLQPIAGTVATS